MRRWALASGVIGLVADLFLVAFYTVAQPWTDTPHETWLGAANDYLMILQFVALLPVEVQVGLVSAGIVASILWAGAISDSPAFSPPVRRLGRIMLAGVPVALLAFLAGTIVTVAAGVEWAWVTGRAAGMIVWFLFALWAVLIGLTSPVRAPRS